MTYVSRKKYQDFMNYVNYDKIEILKCIKVLKNLDLPINQFLYYYCYFYNFFPYL